MQWRNRKPKKQLESSLEEKIRLYAERRGWLWLKFVSPAYDGPPDRIGIRRSRHIFMEIKQDGEEPRPLQLAVHEEMRAHGAEVFTVDNLEDAMEILK
jgi:hypothetical protein